MREREAVGNSASNTCIWLTGIGEGTSNYKESEIEVDGKP